MQEAPPDVVQVAAAVIQRADGTFLLAQRPAGKVYAGYWEFPGGKLERGEPVEHALARELHEELGIEVLRAYPWIVQHFRYPHAHVQLHFHRVLEWRGEPHPHEGQALAWTTPQAQHLAPILPANGPILRALALPHELGITCAAEIGAGLLLQRLDVALASGLRLIMIRERQMDTAVWLRFARSVSERAHALGAKVIINDTVERSGLIATDGVHLTSAALMHLSHRPSANLCGASCHDREQIAHAQALGLDYVVVGPVLPTPSHSGLPGMGWERFAQLIAGSTLPVYAIGGMQRAHLQRAWECGAHGLAMMRAPWRSGDGAAPTPAP